jgi:tetratricopeptide (TPR) repeat protein
MTQTTINFQINLTERFCDRDINDGFILNHAATRRHSNPRLILAVSVFWAFALLTPMFARTINAQDVVVTKRKSAEGTIKRKGVVVEWQGLSLTLSSNEREIEIDNADIVELQTNWGSEYLAGLGELRAGRPQLALERFRSALEAEKRPWARRIIRSKMIDPLMSIENPAAAIDQFLKIVREDPQTRFAYLAPLPWTNSINGLDSQASEFVESNEPLTQLIGASWLLGGAKKPVALKVLEELSNDIDPTVQTLATAQLWRVRVGVNERQIDVWSSIVTQMPREVRAGPYLVLAESQSRAGQVDRAMVNLMRLPINYPDQRSLAAAALYRVAGLLHNKGDEEKAQSILKELITNHPETVWAKQATQ